MRGRRLTATLLVLAVTGCSDRPGAPVAPSPAVAAGDPEAARAFVEEVLRAMEVNSLHRQRIGWTDLRTRVNAAAAAARTIDDTKPALQIALRELNDNHSFIQDPSGSLWLRFGVVNCPAGASRPNPQVPDDIGYVWVRSFAGASNSAAANDYVRALQADMARQDREDLAGWIVDLRVNGGGNMWPMIAGIGPLLGEGVGS